MSLDDLHTLNAYTEEGLRPDGDSFPGLLSFWICEL